MLHPVAGGKPIAVRARLGEHHKGETGLWASANPSTYAAAVAILAGELPGGERLCPQLSSGC